MNVNYFLPIPYKFLNIPKALNSKKGEIKTIIVLIVMAVIGLGILVGSQIRDGRINFLPRASEADTFKIMTFNLLGEPLCGSGVNHNDRMQQITNFIKANNIKLAALQELKKTETDNCKFDLPNILNSQLKPPYFTSTRQYLGSNDNKWFRMFVSSTQAVFPIVEYPAGVTWVQPPDSEGFEAIVLDTEVGRIRFINLHAEGQPILADNIIKFTNQFRSDGIPMILMGDFNLMYTDTNHYYRDIHAPTLEKILQAGFYRACDPLKFPNGNCNDTVKSTSDTANYAIDHILIDKRALFKVKNAYVEQSMRFSDHLPVVVELTNDLAIQNSDQTQQTSISIAPAVPVNIWNTIKPGPGNIYPWTNGGPTAAWESFIAKYVYFCNGKYCWSLNRETLTWNNSGSPIAMDADPVYSGLKASPAGTLPWSNGGPTAAWTWIVPMNGHTVNENLLCNGNYCWRYLRYPNGVAGSSWRDNGSPIYLPTYNDFWKDSRVAALWTGNGITSAWTDPLSSYVTLCNRSDCRSLDYKTWTWRYNGEQIKPYPPGVTEYTTAWTSPVTNIISLCVKDTCWQYDIPSKQYGTNPVILKSTNIATNTPLPSKTPTKAPNAKPVLTTISWNPVSPVTGGTVTGTLIGTDTDSTSVNVEIHVFGQGYSDIIFAKGTATVSAGKWTYSTTKSVPGVIGKFTAYVILNDGVNTVRSGNYDVIVLTPTKTPTKSPTPTPAPFRIWNFTFQAQCSNGKILTTAVYPQQWYWFDSPTTQNPSGTIQPLKITGKTTSKYYLLTQPNSNSLPLVPKTYPSQMTRDTVNTSRLTWLGSSLPAGTYMITMTATGTLCNTPTPTLTKAPTPTLTKAPIATATKVPTPTDKCYRRSQGDADCDGIIHLKDAICWILEVQNKKPVNCISADFNGNRIVGTSDLLEFGIWRTNYIKANTVTR